MKSSNNKKDGNTNKTHKVQHPLLSLKERENQEKLIKKITMLSQARTRQKAHLSKALCPTWRHACTKPQACTHALYLTNNEILTDKLSLLDNNL